MLTIPDSVKTLFKTDGVLKNIRVSFPNGEYPDICNDQIIKESLKFTESVSSREEIEFGLCEGNMISFECVGVGNIKGLEIAVEIDIDVSLLSPRPPETITFSDLPFPYVPINLGKFTVDECKRDARMLKRKVTAYSKISDLTHFDWWVDEVWNASYYTPKDPPRVDLDIMNFIAATNKDLFDTSDDEPITFTKDGSAPLERTLRIRIGSSEYDFKITISGTWYAEIYAMNTSSPYGPWPDTHHIGRVDKCEISSSYQSSVDAMASGLLSQGVPQAFVNKVVEVVESHLPLNVLGAYKYPRFYGSTDYYPPNYPNSPFEPFVIRKGKRLQKGDVFIMPWKLAFFTQLVIGYNNTTYRIYLTDVAFDPTVAVEVSEITIFENERLCVPVISDSVGFNTSWRIFTKGMLSLDMRKMLESNVELLGKFGRISRSGYFELLSISDLDITGLFPVDDLYPADDLYPMEATVISGDTSNMAVVEDKATISVWYEEYFIQFGGLTATYLSSEVLDDNNDPVEVTYENIWNKSQRIYDVSDNEIIKDGTHTAAEIETLVAGLTTALQNLKFYPSEVEIAGLPYIEAGDWVIPSVGGVEIVTLSLSRTMSGIQALRDKMKSD